MIIRKERFIPLKPDLDQEVNSNFGNRFQNPDQAYPEENVTPLVKEYDLLQMMTDNNGLDDIETKHVNFGDTFDPTNEAYGEETA